MKTVQKAILVLTIALMMVGSAFAYEVSPSKSCIGDSCNDRDTGSDDKDSDDNSSNGNEGGGSSNCAKYQWSYVLGQPTPYCIEHKEDPNEKFMRLHWFLFSKA